MTFVETQFSVPVRYRVHFTRDVFAPGNRLLRDVVASADELPARVLVVIDRGACAGRDTLIRRVQRYCARHRDVLTLVAPPLVVPGGERVKNHPAHIDRILQAINTGGLCRHSYVIAIGGGGVLDMVGFAAAIAHRGLRLLRIPTTVLSQDDSGVGVKNSINAFGKKNFLGTFAPPYAVINDADFLRTLSDRDWRAGLSEAVKVALLKDPAFFRFLERHAVALAARDVDAMAHVVRRSARLHMQHIAGSGDPFESGTSRPLDFGHWSAHKLEELTRFSLRHGEAVAIGLALDSTYSMLAGLLSERDWLRILGLLFSLGFRLRVPARFESLRGDATSESLEYGLTEFREHLGGQLTIMLLRRIGVGIEVHDIDRQVLARSIAALREAEGRLRRAAGQRRTRT